MLIIKQNRLITNVFTLDPFLSKPRTGLWVCDRANFYLSWCFFPTLCWYGPVPERRA